MRRGYAPIQLSQTSFDLGNLPGLIIQVGFKSLI